jgi:hypothetical protein
VCIFIHIKYFHIYKILLWELNAFSYFWILIAPFYINQALPSGADEALKVLREDVLHIARRPHAHLP